MRIKAINHMTMAINADHSIEQLIALANAFLAIVIKAVCMAAGKICNKCGMLNSDSTVLIGLVK